ncbi:hypothetical protein [Pedobacter agri]|uniref:hypothetical protein n=1 Tax=Pedobacter agri TaxID=454586 RepID=UPI002931357E|nr:hypothetical protein [Pedobacter agri]
MLSFFLVLSISSKAQKKPFPKSAFAGKWEYEQTHHNLLIVIEFEKGKDYATVTDIGTGEAPPFKLKAQMQGDKLVIYPQTHQNDFYFQLYIKDKTLIFQSQIAIWDRNGNPRPADKNRFLNRVYHRVK